MSNPILQAVLGIAALSFMDALIKAVIGTLPAFEVAFLRYVVGTLAMVPLIALGRPGWPSRETLFANALRAVIVVITATSFFYALGQLPLAEVLVLSFISPAVTAAFAALWLRETIGRRVILALAGGFLGVALIVATGPSLGGEAGRRAGSVLGVAAVLVSAIGYSASNVLLRARAQRDPLLTIVAIQNVAPAAMLAAPAAWFWVEPPAGGWWLLLAIGLLGVAGHLLLARAYARAEASRVAILDYTALIWAVLLGYFAFGEVPTLGVAAGAALILASTWLIGRR